MIEAMKLALEALENNPYALAYSKVITSLRQAIANEALNRMAENARELGLDYEPVQAEKRQWVDLTSDEIWEVYKKHGSLQYKAFARAIEQSLKEKNSQ